MAHLLFPLFERILAFLCICYVVYILHQNSLTL
jgi:hypothetical protein